MPRAKIVCTLGPSSSTPERIGELIDAGMNVARLNFSHGSHEDHAKMLQVVRSESAEAKEPDEEIGPGDQFRFGEMNARAEIVPDAEGRPRGNDDEAKQALDDPSLVAGTIYEGGLRVTTIRPGSPAALGGMQNGDVLVGLHRWATMSEDNIIYIIDQSEVKDAANAVTFYVLRNRVPRPLKGELNLAGK